MNVFGDDTTEAEQMEARRGVWNPILAEGREVADIANVGESTGTAMTLQLMQIAHINELIERVAMLVQLQAALLERFTLGNDDDQQFRVKVGKN